MGKQYLLKVFSGPHIGAEILLSRGKTLIGRSDQCGIVLYDSAISLEHVELIISDQEILVSSLDKLIFIEGKELSEKTVKVDTYQFITIGTTHFSIGINGEDWPQITIPKLNTLPEKPLQQTDDSLSKTQKEDSNSQLSGSSGIRVLFPKLHIRSKRSRLAAVIGVALTTSAAVASMAYSETSSKQHSTNKISLNSPESFKRLQQKITKDKFPNIKLSRQDKQFLVQGSVTNTTQKQQLDKLLKPNLHVVQQQVFVKEKQISSAKTIASELNVDSLTFSMPRPNILSAKGYIENERDWLQAREIISNDIQGVSKIDDKHVETQNHRIQELEKLLEEQELLSLVDIKSTPGQVLVMAELTNENAQHWETIAYTFKQRYGKHPLLKAKIVLLEMDPNDLDIQIRGIVTTGNDSSIVLTPSGSYKEGEQFKNGFTIKTIEPRKIVLSRNHQTIELPINNSNPAETNINTEPTENL